MSEIKPIYYIIASYLKHIDSRVKIQVTSRNVLFVNVSKNVTNVCKKKHLPFSKKVSFNYM